jgi:hypothetical protein
MPIDLNCTCGKLLRAGDDRVGKKVRCPSCQAVLEVPLPQAVPVMEPPPLPQPPPLPLVVEEEVPMVLPAPKKNRDVDAYVVADEPERWRRRDRIEEEDLRLRLQTGRPQYREREPFRNDRSSRGPAWGINAGVGGGCAMMAIAVVWFVVGMAAGWVFFYPPILFIVGLCAVVKGMFGGS